MPETIALSASYEVRLPHFELAVEMNAGPEMVVMFGPSGSGKSMALRTLAGLHRPVRGTIRLRDRILFDSQRGIDLPPQRRRIGYVPQLYALFPHRSIAGNIAYGLNRVSRQERRARVGQLLEMMRLGEQAAQHPAEVSGGQQQRTALARALATEPDLLLMDEPFGALDEDLRTHLRDELRRVQQAYRIPVILVTHSLSEAYSLADQLIVLDRGSVVQSGTRDDVFRRPVSPLVARMMGMSNILQASVIDVESGLARMDWNGVNLVVANSMPLQPGQPVHLGIRPEEVMIIRRNRPLAPGLEHNVIEGVIIEDRSQGLDHLLTVALTSPPGNDHRLQLRIPHPIYLKLELALGDVRRLSIKPADVYVFPQD